ncbi:MAG: tetratricopeptide repeat protein [bacterium]|nr:tetratricopeptide repeat protein [bacterium]
MKKRPYMMGATRGLLSVLMVVQVGLAQSGIDVELQKKAQMLSPELARQIALEKEELRAEAAELTTQALKLMDQGEYKKAHIALTEAVKKDPRNVMAQTKLELVNRILYDTYAGYAQARMAVKDYEEAITYYRTALEHRPGGEEALKGIREARRLLEESVSKNLGKIITDDMEDEEKVALLIKQARDLEVQSRYEEAKALYKQAIRIESENPVPRRLLKDLIEKQGRIIADQRRMERRQVMEDLIKAFFQHPDEYAEVVAEGPGERVETPEQQRRKKIIEEATKKRDPISFKEAQIQEVIGYLSEISGISIVLNLGDKPAQPVTIELASPTVLDAIKYICEANPGLTYTITEYAIVISRGEGEMETRIWSVSPAAVTTAAETKKETGQEQAMDLFAEEAAAPGQEQPEIAEPEIVRQINDLLPGLKERGGSVYLEPTTGTLVVRATPSELDQVDALIEDLERGGKEQLQVEIQARFVEVSNQDLQELSFGMGLRSPFKLLNIDDGRDRALMLNPTDLTGALRRYAKGENSSRYANRLRRTLNMVGAKVGQNQVTDEVIGFFTSPLTDPEVGIVLQAIDNKTNADILSAPAVTSVSGQNRVTIRQINQIIYPEDYTVYKPAKVYAVGQVGEGPTAMRFVSLADVLQGYATVQGYKTEEVGIELIVSPTISEDGRTVDMEITTKVSQELEPRNVICYVGDRTFDLDPIILKVPRFKHSEVTTQVVVNDGETIVLGGMITEQLREYHDKVPLLGDLPLVGRFFRADGSYQEKRNLLIFVTTRVITASGESYREKREREMRLAAARTEEEAAAAPAVEGAEGGMGEEGAPGPSTGESEVEGGSEAAPASEGASEAFPE